jgi:hypothetical protein
MTLVPGAARAPVPSKPRLVILRQRQYRVAHRWDGVGEGVAPFWVHPAPNRRGGASL